MLVLALGCDRRAATVDPGPVVDRPAPIPATELARGKDACAQLIAKLCACPARAKDCALAKGYPEAIEVALEVVASTDSTRRDVLQSQDMIRKTNAHCIEEATKPGADCN
jgi:hypothetical protein